MSAVAYECGVARLESGPTVPLAELELRERDAGLGWSGWGRVRQADRISPAALFARAQEHGLVPEAPIVVSLAPAGRGPVRTWPSVLIDLAVRSGVDGRFEVLVRFADPLTHLASRPLYGVFAERTPGEILAGSIARAAGIASDGGSLRVVHPSLPTMDIRERALADGDRIAYAIAGGEPLLAFIRRVVDESGIRLTVRGLSSGEIRMDLADGVEESGRSDDETVRLALSFESGTAPGNLVVRGLSAVSDGPAGRKSGDRSGEPTRATPSTGWIAGAQAVSEEPGLCAGGQVELTRGTVAEVREWRVLDVTHFLADRRYSNECHLTGHGPGPDDEPPSRGSAPRTLTGAVHEEGFRDGDAVPVDDHGRIPVRLACDSLSVVRLPFVVPAAGAVHGFAPACCQGDRLRVLVHGPFRSEVRGALWSEALAPDEETRRSALSMRAGPGLGVAFHPAERSAELAQ